MTAGSALKQFFSLDVLDGQTRTKDPNLARRLRWSTIEFYGYYAAFVICVPLMFKAVIDISSPSHPNYHLYKDKLDDGLIPGRKVDNSDSQYASFRDQIPTLFIVLALHQGLRYAYDAVVQGTRKEHRLRFDALFGLLFLFVIHGTGALKLLIISTFFYMVAKLGGTSRMSPFLTWTAVVGLLFLNEWYQGYKFEVIHPALAVLDKWSGLLDRWHIHFNITALRLISYNMDWFWAQKAPTKHEVRPVQIANTNS